MAAGFDPAVRPVLLREMRSLMRHRRVPVMLFACAGVAVGIGLFMLVIDLGGGAGLSNEGYAQLGRNLFRGMLLLEGMLIVLLTPALTGGSIAREYEHKTEEALILTRLSVREIVAGKLLAALALVGITLLCALPVISMAFMFGGVSPAELLFFSFTLLSFAACCGATGIYLSACCRNTVTAIALAYCGALAWVALTVPSAIACLVIKFFEAVPVSAQETELSSTRVVWHTLIIYIVGITMLIGIVNLRETLYQLTYLNLAWLCGDALKGDHNDDFSILALIMSAGGMLLGARVMLAAAERAIRRRWPGGVGR